MVSRRQFLSLTVLAPFAIASARSASATEVGDLKRQLRSKLEPRTPGDNAFVDRVVLLVEQGTLPRSLVLKIFQWARPKKPYPFPYFRQALIAQARRIGVTL